MSRKAIVVIAGVAAAGLSYVGQLMLRPAGSPGASEAPPGISVRIVSMAPSITEVLFALGLGDSVVGVSRYCDYPPEAATRPRVGAYIDPNYEAIEALNPDLVVTVPEQAQARKYLKAQGRRVLIADHLTIDGILASIEMIGQAGGVSEQAAELVAELRDRMAAVAERTREVRRPTVLISAGRSVGAGVLEDVFIAGKGGFYDQMLEIAGGVNAYQGELLFPAVSAEGILDMDPDVVIEILDYMTQPDLEPARVVADWHCLPALRAVRNERVYVLDDEFVVTPGPRFVLTLEKLARVLHPDLDWDNPKPRAAAPSR